MGVEVAESNLAINVENSSEANMPVENGKLNITFGSHGVEEPPKVEVNKVSESNLPKDAVDEWPEPKQIHSFYVVKYRPIEDQNLKVKLDLAEKELQKKNQARVQIIEKLKAKRGDRSQLIGQLRALGDENKQFRSVMDEKRKEMEPLQQALGKLRGSSGGGSGGGREKSTVICSSEEELNDVIKSYQYRIQHESIPLSEEKQILREIKQLEATREKVIAYAAERAKIQDSLGEKGAIQDQVKLIGVGLDGVRKEKQVIYTKIKQLDEEKLAIEKDIGVLEDELTALTQKRDAIYDNIREMRKQREEGNTPFYENRMLLTKAKVLAANKDVAALKELQDTEVDKFVSLWNSNKAFRDDYEKRILTSLDMRQLSRDGRLRNSNEKPLVPVEKPTPSQPEVVKTTAKQQQPPKAEIPPPAQVDATEQKVQKGGKAAKNLKEGNKKTEKIDVEDKEEEVVLPTEKEREKRARKKTGAGGAAVESEEATEAVAEVAEPEKMEEKVETLVPQKNKDRKENAIRNRGGRPRGGADSLPKAILKRKKATNYWVYIAPAAALVVLVLMVIGYSYLS
ncbi:hypothetical protein RD792_007304 [Penstemon davidsonii]|uniref:Proton pump-interactor 1 n=1 Tax=Penstemon davidsonii TaxID=160366 RepID=A0ABR0D682_9LAMI|nr:hypothetical protein RD792_007304 [Penstemon davidsonii]